MPTLAIPARVVLVLLTALCLLLPLGARAATPAPSPVPAATAATPVETDALPVKPAQLVVFNRPIILFRAPFLGNPPEERVRAALRRIDQLVERGQRAAISQQTIPQGILILIGDNFIFAVTPGDVDTLGGETLESTAAASVAALQQVAAETRESRDLKVLGKALLSSVIATGVLAALLWILWHARRWVSARLQRVARQHAEKLRIGEAQLLQQEHVLNIVRRVSSAVFTLIGLLLAYRWLDYVLQRFPYTRRWGEQLDHYLVSTVEVLGKNMLDALPDLLIAFLIFLIARFIARMLRGFFDRVQAGRLEVGWLDVDTAGPTARIVSVLVWAFALVMAYPYLPGSGTDAFKGISVLLGLMVSIGASGTIGQAASGLILMYTRTIRPGEYVKVGDHEGTVTELGMFTTRIRTGMGEELTLPNSLIVGNVTKNYSRATDGGGFVLDTTVTIGYDAPWRQIHALLLEAAHRTDGIAPEPAARVFQTALSDFYVEYRLACYATPSEPRPRAVVLTALHQNIQDVFNEHGVQIMSPHYLGDPPQAKIVPPDQWYAAPAQPPSDTGAR
ncbi:MAG: mechanosensitive ion channel family protein [Burkholderiales bacterium]